MSSSQNTILISIIIIIQDCFRNHKLNWSLKIEIQRSKFYVLGWAHGKPNNE